MIIRFLYLSTYYCSPYVEGEEKGLGNGLTTYVYVCTLSSVFQHACPKPKLSPTNVLRIFFLTVLTKPRIYGVTHKKINSARIVLSMGEMCTVQQYKQQKSLAVREGHVGRVF